MLTRKQWLGPMPGLNNSSLETGLLAWALLLHSLPACLFHSPESINAGIIQWIPLFSTANDWGTLAWNQFRTFNSGRAHNHLLGSEQTHGSLRLSCQCWSPVQPRALFVFLSALLKKSNANNGEENFCALNKMHVRKRNLCLYFN